MMKIEVRLTTEPIEAAWRPPAPDRGSGASVEFRGTVRDREDGRVITALRYEAYETMARRQMEIILAEEGRRHRGERAVVWHRHGWIPVGEVAVLVWIESRHRGEAFALLAAFMDRLKRDVPIWKVGEAAA